MNKEPGRRIRKLDNHICCLKMLLDIDKDYHWMNKKTQMTQNIEHCLYKMKCKPSQPLSKECMSKNLQISGIF
jgi:hypothetical protein